MFICWNSVRGNRKLLLLGYVFISVMVAIGINIYRQVFTNARFKRIHVNSAAVPLRLGVEYNEFLAFLGGLICRHTAKLAFFKYTKKGKKNKERKVFFHTKEYSTFFTPTARIPTFIVLKYFFSEIDKYEANLEQ